MKKIIKLSLLSFLIISNAYSKQLWFEAAAGVVSPFSPFSSKWQGAVAINGLYSKELAFRGSYQINRYFWVTSTFGWLKQSDIPREENRIVVPYPLLLENNNNAPKLRELIYYIPSIRLNLSFIRADIGAVLYRSNIWSLKYNDNYPFNGSHKLKPALGIELGQRQFYLILRLNSSYPYYSDGGPLQIGLGDKISQFYEQKVYFSILAAGNYMIGYRGEIRVYKNTALSVGFGIGGAEHHNCINLNLGIKTALGK
jgi:hypothetical protein